MRVLRWRDLWIWDTCNVVALALVPMVISFALTGVLLPYWGKRALLCLLLWAMGLAFAGVYAWVGASVRRLKAALPRPTGQVAEALMFKRPFQTPGLAVLHADRLELIPITGSTISVRLEDISAVGEVRWFNGTRLWWKKGFVLDLANGQRVGVAVPEPFARQWRSRLSRGTLPESNAKPQPASGEVRMGAPPREAGVRAWKIAAVVILALVAVNFAIVVVALRPVLSKPQPVSKTESPAGVEPALSGGNVRTQQPAPLNTELVSTPGLTWTHSTTGYMNMELDTSRVKNMELVNVTLEPTPTQPTTAASPALLQFRWVARDGETNAPADELTYTDSRKKPDQAAGAARGRAG